MSLYEDLRDLAVETARETGRMLVDERPAAGPDVVRTKSSPTDVVTQMDRAAEKMIIERIGAARPGDAFLGEEGGDQGAADGAVRWVVDPIDGTVNYLYDLPDWAVSIAAEVAGRTVAAAIAMPRRGELYTAVEGGGARLHTASGVRDLRVNTGVPLERALVATGFGYAAERRAHQARVLTGVLPFVRDIRRGGSCCVDLCSLAAGRVDAYFERGVQAWDVAAGRLVVTEAGGRIGGLGGAALGPEFALAAAPELFDALQSLLVPLDPAHD
ncbi:inositol monophosphatase family protein [Actinomadura parmotrematis]|uniref:Inositol-1-monophosphatase n=1 Tax=Actinomadura parmotrematis TaxID=2864039 RepID=A0ABS7FWD8_9ACTN|nr:inositol monophosphatase family protein [Actinomadura parmotrematis]MBW8484744.1 inositol monophosphatase [Actinomadura parmotrematis]